MVQLWSRLWGAGGGGGGALRGNSGGRGDGGVRFMVALRDGACDRH